MWSNKVEDFFKAVDAVALSHWVVTAVAPIVPSVLAYKNGEALLEHWEWSLSLLVGLGVLHPIRKALTAKKTLSESAPSVKTFVKGNDNQVRVRKNIELPVDMQAVEGDRNQIDADRINRTK